MKYLILIYDNEDYWQRVTESEMEAVMRCHGDFGDDLREAGKHHGSARLEPASTSTCVRRSGSGKVVTDGPYTETKEQIGGFYMIDAKDLDEALAYAKRLPLSDPGVVEIRPIADLDA